MIDHDWCYVDHVLWALWGANHTVGFGGMALSFGQVYLPDFDWGEVRSAGTCSEIGCN